VQKPVKNPARKPRKELRNAQGAIAFGKRLRALRQNLKLSQQQLATSAEIERVTVKRIELAQFSPTLDTLISLARALGKPFQEFFLDNTIIELDRTETPVARTEE
jgi:transcriptional regulator with XRE-family HTH domain